MSGTKISMMTQFDLLPNDVMDIFSEVVNVFCVSRVNLDDVYFDAFLNEEVRFLANQGGDFCLRYPWSYGYQG